MKCSAEGAVAQGTGAVTPAVCPTPPADPAVVAAAEGYALFNHIRTEDLGKLLGCLAARVRHLEADEFIMNNREDKPLVGVVLSGQVAMISEDMFGKRSILTLLACSLKSDIHTYDLIVGDINYAFKKSPAYKTVAAADHIPARR